MCLFVTGAIRHGNEKVLQRGALGTATGIRVGRVDKPKEGVVRTATCSVVGKGYLRGIQGT